MSFDLEDQEYDSDVSSEFSFFDGYDTDYDSDDTVFSVDFPERRVCLASLPVNLPELKPVCNPEEEIIRKRGRRMIPRTPEIKRKHRPPPLDNIGDNNCASNATLSSSKDGESGGDGSQGQQQDSDDDYDGPRKPQPNDSPFTRALRHIPASPPPPPENPRIAEMRKRLLSPDFIRENLFFTDRSNDQSNSSSNDSGIGLTPFSGSNNNKTGTASSKANASGGGARVVAAKPTPMLSQKKKMKQARRRLLM